MGLRFNLLKSQLVPTTSLTFLGLNWDTVRKTVALSSENRLRCHQKVFRALSTRTMSRRNWESIIGSLNFASEVIPFSRIRVRRLLLEGRSVFSDKERDLQIHFPKRLKHLLRWWMMTDRLSETAPWTPPFPTISLTTDASDLGWGYQSNQGHQGRGMWTPSQRSSHIIVKELRVIVLALQREPSLRDQSLQVLTDKTSTVSCVNRQGSARSRNLLQVSEQLFNLLKTMRVI